MTARLIVCVLCAWFALSAFCQLRIGACRRVRRFDWFGLLPRYNFFAPHPIVGDLLVQYRYGTDDSVAPWTDLNAPARRRWWHAVWPGERRAKKAAFSSALRVVTVYRQISDDPRRLTGTVPYRLLLAWVARHSPGDSWVQFRVVQVSYGPDGGRRLVTVRSARHLVSEVQRVGA
jgi:hypothetical protein